MSAVAALNPGGRERRKPYRAAELAELWDLDVSTVYRMIYTGRLDLAEAYSALLDWQKVDGLIPVIAQETTGQVLMFAYANREAVLHTLRTGQGTYWSRSRKQLWVKGDTSGHTQKVLEVRWDCDRDSLLYRVEQTGGACHLPQHACFGDATFNLAHLEQILQERRSSADPGSYTAKLFADPALLNAKILEEAQELTEAESDRDVVWEAADVIFFALTKLAARGLTLAQVEKELRGRHGRRRA